MSAALPPVTDCGCTTSAAATTSATGCCPTVGVLNPNVIGAIPSDPTKWVDYKQLADIVAGPVVQIWTWNPNLSVWQ